MSVWIGGFSLAATKLPNYIMPAYPAAALLVSALAIEAVKRSAWLYPRWMGIGIGGIAFGALLADTVGGNMPGVKASNVGLQKFVFGFIGLPFGLLMVVITGADLYTGTVGSCFAAFLARRISFFVSGLGRAAWVVSSG